jgi:hypothetical protein
MCGLADDFGGFAVTATETTTDIAGSVADGVVPASVLERLAEAGDCVVLRRNNPFCDPACDPGQACSFDGTCVPWPANQDLGTVTIDGLVQPSVMEPVFPGNTYYDTTLPHPAFAAGGLLTLAMPGGAFGPLTLYGVGVEPLDVPGAAWMLESGVDLVVTWPAPVATVVRSEVAVEISIDQHGVSPGVLRCTFADDGEGTVPGAIVAALVDAGVTGFPSGTITRRTADRATLPGGCLDFVVASPRGAAVDVVGHTPCVSSNECPDDQHCNEDLQICE